MRNIVIFERRYLPVDGNSFTTSVLANTMHAGEISQSGSCIIVAMEELGRFLGYALG